MSTYYLIYRRARRCKFCTACCPPSYLYRHPTNQMTKLQDTDLSLLGTDSSDDDTDEIVNVLMDLLDQDSDDDQATQSHASGANDTDDSDVPAWAGDDSGDDSDVPDLLSRSESDEDDVEPGIHQPHRHMAIMRLAHDEGDRTSYMLARTAAFVAHHPDREILLMMPAVGHSSKIELPQCVDGNNRLRALEISPRGTFAICHQCAANYRRRREASLRRMLALGHTHESADLFFTRYHKAIRMIQR